MGASTISISIEETNRIRGFFGLKLIPVPDASKRFVNKNKSLKDRLHEQDKNVESPTYKSSEFIDIGLLNKKHYTKTSKSKTTPNLLSVSSDEEDNGKGDWLSKIKSGEKQDDNKTATTKVNNNNQNTKKRTSSPSELRDKLAQSIIMTLKEQEIMDEDGLDDGSNPQGKKDILTKEEEFDSKDIDRVEKSFKSKKKRNFEESESTEQRAAKKLQKVTFKGKMRVSFSDSDNDSEDANDPNTPSGDYAPVKIKKRKAKTNNASNDKMRVKNFQMKKVELHDEDDYDEDDELAELNQVLTRERQKHNVSKPKRNFIKKVNTVKPISTADTWFTQSTMSTDFLNSLSIPGNDLTSGIKNTYAVTESLHLKKASDLIPDETSQPDDPNFYDGLASTLNYLKHTNDAAPDRKIFHSTENHSLQLTGKDSSIVDDHTELDPKTASPVVNLKYLDETTGEELDPKKAFQQFNKNFYKNKKRKTKSLNK